MFDGALSFCSLAPARPSRRPPAQSRAKPPSGKAVRGFARPVCKTEPGMESPAGEQPVDDEPQWLNTRGLLVHASYTYRCGVVLS